MSAAEPRPVLRAVALLWMAAAALAGCTAAKPLPPPPPPSEFVLPVGGPQGYYTAPIIDDRFGSNRTGANITSLSQFSTSFNAAAVYGFDGRGWDAYEKHWDKGPANLRMAADHLELRPGGTGLSAYIVSHFEFLPKDDQRIYFEARVVMGRGHSGHSHGWPGLWHFAGNEAGSVNHKSELDVNETYYDLFATNGGFCFKTTAWDQPAPGSSHPREDEEHWTCTRDDPTINWHVYGWELWNQGGRLFFSVYLDGARQYTSKVGIGWTSSPPAVLFGWAPGPSGQTDGTDVMKLDYFRVWRPGGKAPPPAGTAGRHPGAS